MRARALCSALLLALAGGCVTSAPPPPAAVQRSGFEDMGASLQAMQRDDSMNPAMLAVLEGEQLWSRAPTAATRSCASCHGELSSMRGVAPRYPAYDEAARRPVNLATRINLCRQRHQSQPALAAEDAQALALEAAVALQSRGLPIAPGDDRRLQPFRERGERLFNQRIGQLDLSCAQCHEQHAGGRLGGTLIPQGQATGYPIYRLEWQALGSLGRRLRNCMAGVRSEAFATGSVEMAELELHLAQRARGMLLETPAVRP